MFCLDKEPQDLRSFSLLNFGIGDDHHLDLDSGQVEPKAARTAGRGILAMLAMLGNQQEHYG